VAVRWKARQAPYAIASDASLEIDGEVLPKLLAALHIDDGVLVGPRDGRHQIPSELSMSRRVFREILQEELLPFFAARGFEQLPLPLQERSSREFLSAFRFGHLVRPRSMGLDLAEVQVDPRRTAFVVNFGIADPGRLHPRGQFRGQNTMVSDLAVQCRLYSSRAFMTWFGGSWLGSNSAKHVHSAINRAISYAPEIEDYFKTEAVGPHVKCVLYSGDGSGISR
jgi:hypothetical protein